MEQTQLERFAAKTTSD